MQQTVCPCFREVKKILGLTFNAVVVRHPFLRFVSAFKDRIGNPNYKGTEALRADILKEAVARGQNEEKAQDGEKRSVVGSIMGWFGLGEARAEEKEVNIDEGEEGGKSEQVPTFEQFVEYFRQHREEMRGQYKKTFQFVGHVRAQLLICLLSFIMEKEHLVAKLTFVYH